jgi:phosphohistidine phosphatase
MKTIILVRHAKSSWDNMLLPDLLRPLNKRGRKDAALMAKLFHLRHADADMLISSNATRAESTAELFLTGMACSVEIEPRLYHASEDMLLRIVQQLPNAFNKVALFGHQPGLSDFVELLTGQPIPGEKFPTCAMVELTFNVDEWSEVKAGRARMLHYDIPKMHKSS